MSSRKVLESRHKDYRELFVQRDVLLPLGFSLKLASTSVGEDVEFILAVQPGKKTALQCDSFSSFELCNILSTKQYVLQTGNSYYV